MLHEGDRVIAKTTRLTDNDAGGYVKGDTLIYKSPGSAVDYILENITRPELNSTKTGHSYAFKYEVKPIKNDSKKDAKSKVYFLGIPIFTIKDVNHGK